MLRILKNWMLDLEVYDLEKSKINSTLISRVRLVIKIVKFTMLKQSAHLHAVIFISLTLHKKSCVNWVSCGGYLD